MSEVISYFRDEVKVKSVNVNEEYLMDILINIFFK